MGGTVHNRCDLCFVRSVLTFGVAMVLLAVVEAEAQVENSVLSTRADSPAEIQRIVAEATVAGPQSDQFVQLIDRAIEITSKRTLVANSHSPWQIFHCILALRHDTVLRLGDKKVNAIQWLSTTEPQFDNQPWMLLTSHGAKFHPYTRIYAFEGHPSQFLALLSHSNLPLDHEFRVQGKTVTLNDLVNNTMKEVNTNEEVTWVLWALQHFLKPDATWYNQHNEPWSIERLVQIETSQPVVGAPCGGNHRLYALTRARDKYLQNGGRLRGVWLQADQRIKQHIEIARSLQNSDGSFSSESYKGPGYTPDVNKRFNTTGHTMEFLSASLPKERLNEPWVRNAVWTLSRELILQRDAQIDCGPLFHSLNALILYRERISPKHQGAEETIQTPPLLREAKVPRAETSQNSESRLKVTPKLETEPKSISEAASKPKLTFAETAKTSTQATSETGLPALALTPSLLGSSNAPQTTIDSDKLSGSFSKVAAAGLDQPPASQAGQPKATSRYEIPKWTARRVSIPRILQQNFSVADDESFEIPVVRSEVQVGPIAPPLLSQENGCGSAAPHQLPLPVDLLADEPASAIQPANQQ
ncbi:hypothetical protein [Schlesneria sp. DSM 10557]|uniref:hypothetical protein n=1 Tax=Schlesneria sp. DSM 10557 TaxID=3044399 RepID=UPI00359F348C